MNSFVNEYLVVQRCKCIILYKLKRCALRMSPCILFFMSTIIILLSMYNSNVNELCSLSPNENIVMSNEH